MGARGKPQLKSRIQKQPERSGVGRDALLRLATNPKDACALVAVYDAYGNALKASANRWFGKDSAVRAKAINSLLAAIARQAPTYDPLSMHIGEWVNRCAETEARRLREVLDETLRHALGAKGDV